MARHRGGCWLSNGCQAGHRSHKGQSNSNRPQECWAKPAQPCIPNKRPVRSVHRMEYISGIVPPLHHCDHRTHHNGDDKADSARNTQSLSKHLTSQLLIDSYESSKSSAMCHSKSSITLSSTIFSARPRRAWQSLLRFSRWSFFPY